MRLAAVVGLCGVVCACGVNGRASTDLEQRADEIRGGTVDADGGYPSVFIVRMRFDNATQFACSATLITPRSLMLAAHCFDAAGAGATSMVGAWATNLNPAPPSADPRWIPLSATRQNPLWTSSSPSINDIAMGLLDNDAGIALPTSTSPYLLRNLTAADVGKPLEVVGYGITARGATDPGTRREVDLPLANLTAAHVEVGDMSGKGICNGDSGGPSFIRDRDGVRRVAGIHSYDSSVACNFGQDSRVDLFGAFIRQWLTDEEGGATCAEDGLCKAGCTPADVDCVCQADSVCNGACPNLLTDPDCPADCVANGVCATQSCPRPDPDCVPELSACTQASQCQYRQCPTDPQRNTTYCSEPCSAASPCPASLGASSCVGGVCLKEQLPTAVEGQACTVGATFCLGATTCTALVGGPLQCLRSCTTDPDCGALSHCVTGQGSTKVCEPLTPEGSPCTRGATACAAGTACTARPGDALLCRRTCTLDTDCPAAQVCDYGSFAEKLCRPKEVDVPAIVATFPADKSGCAAAPGGALAWLALVLARRRGVRAKSGASR